MLCADGAPRLISHPARDQRDTSGLRCAAEVDATSILRDGFED